MKTDSEKVVGIWWDYVEKEIAVHANVVGERRELLQRRLDELKSNNAMGVAFFYELEKRLSPRRKYRFGKPFPYITDKQFSALCGAWPLYGFTDLTKDASLVLSHGHGDYDLNLEGGFIAVRNALTAMEKELGLPPRSINKRMKSFEEDKREYVETAEDQIFTALKERIQHERLHKARIKRTYAKLVSTGKIQEMEMNEAKTKGNGGTRTSEQLERLLNTEAPDTPDKAEFWAEQKALAGVEFWQQAKVWADQKTLTISQARKMARRDAEELRARFAARLNQQTTAKGERKCDYSWEWMERLDELLRSTPKQRTEAQRSTLRRAGNLYKQYREEAKATHQGQRSWGNSFR